MMGVSTMLLQTKLFVPAPGDALVARPRLLAALDAGLAGKLTLVSAPAGFGKTTLVAEWVQQQRGAALQVAWVALDEQDNDPSRFFSYVLGALQSVHGAIGQDLAQASQLPAPEAIVSVLINDVTAVTRSGDLNGRLLLVLDDYHAIQSRAIHEAMAFFLDHMPPAMHLVLLSRADPPLPLARLRARRQMQEIRARDLRFSHAEAAAFLQHVMGLELSKDDVATLERRTEGWIAGLQLAAHSLQLQDDKSAFLAAFAGDDRYVADYLLEEVLLLQPAALQTFLLRTSILARFNAALCDAVARVEDSQTTLEYLEQANLFLLPLDNRRQWYRYHQLFADLLRERLGESYDDVAELHRRASRWYAANGFFTEAVQHALAAGDHAAAAELIETGGAVMFLRSELTTLTGWQAQLPAQVLAQRPALCMQFAWAWLATGHPAACENCLRAIETAVNFPMSALAAQPDALEPAARAALVEVTVLRSRLALDQLRVSEALSLAERVLPYLRDATGPVLYNTPRALLPVALFNMGVAHQMLGRLEAAAPALTESAVLGRVDGNVHIYVLAMGRLANVQRLQGNLQRAAQTCRTALEFLGQQGQGVTPLAGLLYAELGTVLYEWNDLALAREHLERGIALAKPWSSWEALLPGYLGLALVARAVGNWDEALEALEVLVDSTPDNATAVAPLASVMRARLLAEQGDRQAAARCLSRLDLRSEIPALREAESVQLLRAWLLLGEHKKVEAELPRLLHAAENGRRWERVLELLLIQTVNLARQERSNEALAALRQALHLGESESFVRVFLDWGAPLAALLYSILDTGHAAEYVGHLLAEFDTPLSASEAPDVVEPVLEPLSERELEVLVLMADGMTNREIGRELVITHGTVKVHAHNIYGKLNVDGRIRAVAKARSLGLI